MRLTKRQRFIEMAVRHARRSRERYQAFARVMNDSDVADQQVLAAQDAYQAQSRAVERLRELGKLRTRTI